MPPAQLYSFFIANISNQRFCVGSTLDATEVTVLSADRLGSIFAGWMITIDFLCHNIFS